MSRVEAVAKPIRIAMCVCPQGHCLLAIVFDERERSHGDALSQLRNIFAIGMGLDDPFEPVCLGCGLTAWSFLISQHRFATLRQAIPTLEWLSKHIRIVAGVPGVKDVFWSTKIGCISDPLIPASDLPILISTFHGGFTDGQITENRSGSDDGSGGAEAEASEARTA